MVLGREIKDAIMSSFLSDFQTLIKLIKMNEFIYLFINLLFPFVFFYESLMSLRISLPQFFFHNESLEDSYIVQNSFLCVCSFLQVCIKPPLTFDILMGLPRFSTKKLMRQITS